MCKTGPCVCLNRVWRVNGSCVGLFVGSSTHVTTSSHPLLSSEMKRDRGWSPRPNGDHLSNRRYFTRLSTIILCSFDAFEVEDGADVYCVNFGARNFMPAKLFIKTLVDDFFIFSGDNQKC